MPLVPEMNLGVEFKRSEKQFDCGATVQAGATLAFLNESGAFFQPNVLLWLVAHLRVSSVDDGQEVDALEKLKHKNVVDHATARCIIGTREATLAKVDDPTAPNILWLKGSPGSGKSATVTTKLRECDQLGSSFSFRREEATVTTSSAFWHQVSFNLARQYPLIRKRVLQQLKKDDHLPAAGARNIFVDIVQGPLQGSLEPDIPSNGLVIDALDGGLKTCRSAESTQLLNILKLWETLPRQFKLVITSCVKKDITKAISDISYHLIMHYPSPLKISGHIFIGSLGHCASLQTPVSYLAQE